MMTNFVLSSPPVFINFVPISIKIRLIERKNLDPHQKVKQPIAIQDTNKAEMG